MINYQAVCQSGDDILLVGYILHLLERTLLPIWHPFSPFLFQIDLIVSAKVGNHPTAKQTRLPGDQQPVHPVLIHTSVNDVVDDELVGLRRIDQSIEDGDVLQFYQADVGGNGLLLPLSSGQTGRYGGTSRSGDPGQRRRQLHHPVHLSAHSLPAGALTGSELPPDGLIAVAERIVGLGLQDATGQVVGRPAVGKDDAVEVLPRWATQWVLQLRHDGEHLEGGGAVAEEPGATKNSEVAAAWLTLNIR